MAKFSCERISDLLYPELVGVGSALLVHTVTRLIDAGLGWKKPFRRTQDYGHILVLGGSIYLYGKNIAPDFAKGAFLSGVTLLAKSGADVVFGVAAPKIRALREGRKVEIEGRPALKAGIEAKEFEKKGVKLLVTDGSDLE